MLFFSCPNHHAGFRTGCLGIVEHQSSARIKRINKQSSSPEDPHSTDAAVSHVQGHVLHQRWCYERAHPLCYAVVPNATQGLARARVKRHGRCAVLHAGFMGNSQGSWSSSFPKSCCLRLHCALGTTCGTDGSLAKGLGFCERSRSVEDRVALRSGSSAESKERSRITLKVRLAY